mmetsp:Transcript_31857/g.46931  ORF Transcript_31857/g.46931 Transcript_31857/m.46931 type:complete len:105 (-) Transcript_31857:227-541(-)
MIRKLYKNQSSEIFLDLSVVFHKSLQIVAQQLCIDRMNKLSKNSMSFRGRGINANKNEAIRSTHLIDAPDTKDRMLPVFHWQLHDFTMFSKTIVVVTIVISFLP